jgi:Ni/Co efflux regulator RcnB
MFNQKLKESSSKTIGCPSLFTLGVLSSYLAHITQSQQNKGSNAIHLNDLQSIESVQKPEHEHWPNQTQEQQKPGYKRQSEGEQMNYFKHGLKLKKEQRKPFLFIYTFLKLISYA